MIKIPDKVSSSVVTAIILGAGMFTWDYLTNDPELAIVQNQLDVLKVIAAQNSVSNTQQTASIKSLALDRAVPALKSSIATQTELTVKYQGAPLYEWSADDQALWAGADIQIANATTRLLQ